MAAPFRGALFDVYGTLLDVGAVREACAEVTDRPDELAARWRAKQLEYTWLLTLMGRFEPFDRVTERALESTSAAMGLGLDGVAAGRLVDAWRSLTPMPEAAGALARMREAGWTLAVLSNGTKGMLDPALSRAGLAALLDRVVTVEQLKVYKPDPRVYQHGLDEAGLTREETLFVSGNPFDASGAAAAGLRVGWLDRAGAGPHDFAGDPPELVARDLDELTAKALA